MRNFYKMLNEILLQSMKTIKLCTKRKKILDCVLRKIRFPFIINIKFLFNLEGLIVSSLFQTKIDMLQFHICYSQFKH